MKNYSALEKIARERGSAFLREEPLCRHTTFQIGGPADVFIDVSGEAALAALLKVCRKEEIPFLVVGKGSDLLISDQGFRGAVLHLGAGFCELRREEDRVYCGAGNSLARLCRFAQQSGLAGLEFAWGIPGSAGGAVYMNAGAYGGEMKDVLVCCRHVSAEGVSGGLQGEALGLSYRHSAYHDNGAVVTSLVVQLRRDDPDSVDMRMQDYMQRRKSKQPLEYPSAGSVFKRPPGYFAGGLIEQCGLKGKRIGGAMVSTKHAGFIVNTGNATCEDVCSLIDLIQETVLRETGVALECEVKWIR
jgi:UDP-N-acetylmuramate dehydrogenase